MKKLLLSFCSLTAGLCLFVQVHAQDKSLPSAEERATKLTDWMQSTLQLTPEQLPTVKDINMKYAEKVNSIVSNTMSRSDKMKALNEDNKAKDEELKKVFTESQYKTYQVKKKEMNQKVKDEIKARKQAS